MRRWYRFLVLKVDIVVGRERLISGHVYARLARPSYLLLIALRRWKAGFDYKFGVYFYMCTPIKLPLHQTYQVLDIAD